MLAEQEGSPASRTASINTAMEIGCLSGLFCRPIVPTFLRICEQKRLKNALFFFRVLLTILRRGREASTIRRSAFQQWCGHLIGSKRKKS
ncbi:hypothetical protein KFK09_013749 [Dendrobium nobile]|uniref:Uncharacterized protein n=1 Tax=Dendrobium nobile TaxID=94219 RepID=A0A8T3B867_DENNO|nr:hypothetical protein KFK09_013749 [Dendrobium nobile]